MENHWLRRKFARESVEKLTIEHKRWFIQFNLGWSSWTTNEIKEDQLDWIIKEFYAKKSYNKRNNTE